MNGYLLAEGRRAKDEPESDYTDRYGTIYRFDGDAPVINGGLRL